MKTEFHKKIEKIKKEVYKAYCKHGQSSAFNVANKYPLNVDYEYCIGCECDSPAISNECLICGQNTISYEVPTAFQNNKNGY